MRNIKRLYCLLGILLCFSLTSCSTETLPAPASSEEAVNSKEDQMSWGSLLSSIQGEDIGYPSWSIYRENPTNEELAQYLQNAATHQSYSSEEAFGDTIWALYLYVDAPPDDELDHTHELSLCAGLQENIVCIWGGDAFPKGKCYIVDSDLYWLIRSINDSNSSIDEATLSTCQDAINKYIANEQNQCGNPDISVELLSLEKQFSRSNIGVDVYTIGTVWTSESPEELLKYMTGGGYFDSQLRLHPDGNSVKSNMLLINEKPVGFISWDALSEIESRQDFSSGEALLESIKSNKAWFTPI